jgi:hypothetical protein
MPVATPSPARRSFTHPTPQRITAFHYAQDRPGCAVTGLAQFVATGPPLPTSVDGRRQDVYQLYQEGVRARAAGQPVVTYTVEIPGMELARSAAHGSVAARVGPDVELTDACRYPTGVTFDPAVPPVDLPGRSLVIAEGHANSYFHFMMNSLVRLAVVLRTHPRERFDHVVVTDDAPPFVRQALDMLAIDPRKVVSLTRTPHVRCEHAVFGQYLSEVVYPHRLATQLVRELFPASVYTGRRLYVERAAHRRVINDVAAREVMAKFGFETVRSESMSILDQARLFGSAEAVVGTHGAGLSNLIFCPPGTKVIEMLAPRFVETIYWFLATSAGHGYGTLIGNGADPPLALKLAPGGWRSSNPDNVEVDVARLEQLCVAMGL